MAELDPAWWWLPGAADVHIAPEHDTERIFAFGEAELFAVADALGARSLNAVDVFGGHWSLDDAAEAFAALCRRAAEHGLLVQLEFLPWSKIPDLEAAWSVVRQAGEPNGGLTVDAWHYFRSGSAARGTLRDVPGERIVGVQLAMRRPWPRPTRCMPPCTNACCPVKASSIWPVWSPTCGPPAPQRQSGSRCSRTPCQLAPEEVGRRAGAALRSVLVPHP